MIMNHKAKKIFVDSRETILMYYRYLHLGLFYPQISKNEDLSCKSKNISIDFGANKYLLRKDIIKSSLKDMYEKSQSPDFFFHLILNNYIRGTTMALFEALKEEEIKKLFLEHIFENDKEARDNFHEVVRFIRHTFSHNIRDRIELRKKDYEGMMKRLKGKSINFFFDYTKSPILIPINSIPINREYHTIKIDIDFNKIKDGVAYTDIISEYQTLLFIELCYNCMEHLKDKLKDKLG